MNILLWECLLYCSWSSRCPYIISLLTALVSLAFGCFRLRTARVTHFEYQPLKDPKSYIRLLILHPSPNYEDPVWCRLIAVRLDRAPSYEALSYHWGESTQNQPIFLNGRQKLITRSLLLALKDLRRPFRPRILWADGLCINQSEKAVEERNAQLLQMRAVFSQASRVMAWLSEANLNFWTMFELFNKLEKEQKFDADGRVVARRRTRTTDAIWLRISMETMARLAGLPWWRRVWVFQEVIVAKELTIFCGVVELSYSAVATAAWLGASMSIDIRQNPSWFSHIMRMWILRQEYLIKQQLSLVDLLSTVRGPGFGVTDPKDRVLALLGLAREQREISRVYQPDYKQSLEEVYCDVTRMAIGISRSTKVLSYAGFGPSQLPSWSPDWRISSCQRDSVKLHSTLDSITGVLFRASARSKAIMCGGTPTEILKLQGVVFDTVEHCRPGQSLSSAWSFCKKQQGKHTGPRNTESSYLAYQSPEDGSSWLTEAINQDERYEASSGVARNCYLASQDPMLAILLALQDIWYDGGWPRRMNIHVLRSLRASLSKRGYEHHRFCDEIRRYNGRSLEDDILSNLNCEFRLLDSGLDDSTELGEKEISSIYDVARDKIVNLIVGYTTKGYFMSSSSCNVIEGDIICILLGGSVPYLLRRKEDHYILIGEVYIHGIMDGEVLEAVSRQEHELEWISLK